MNLFTKFDLARRGVASNLKKWIDVYGKYIGNATKLLIVAGIIGIGQPVASLAQASTSDASKPVDAVSVKMSYEDKLVATTDKNYQVKLADSAYQIAKKLDDAKRLQAIKVTQIATVSFNFSNEEKIALVKAAASAHGIDWKILAAVWQVESGQQMVTAVKSYAGAGGPCQFMPGTWKKYAQDGNGDGKADINDARDCLYGSAKLLAANGASGGNNDRALFSYNHSLSYVNKVKKLAESIQ